MLRASGINWDLRKVHGLQNKYNSFDFKIPLGKKGDCYDRFLIRVEEIKQSIQIMKTTLNLLPSGPFLGNNSKIIAPSRFQMKLSMESMIHHFKLFTEGFSVFESISYQSFEAPKGEFAYFLFLTVIQSLTEYILEHLDFSICRR